MAVPKWLAVLAVFTVSTAVALAGPLAPASSHGSSRWSGVYLGPHLGHASADYDGIYDSSDLDENPPDSHIPAEKLDDGGILGGVFGGWSRQSGALVFGVEGDLASVDISKDAFEPEDRSEKSTATVDWLASARCRIGWGGESVLLYGTAGLAYVKGDYKVVDQGDGKGEVDFDQAGFVAGGGVEWGAWKRLSLRAEGLYYSFGDKVRATRLTDDSDPNDFIELENILVFRAGLTVHF